VEPTLLDPQMASSPSGNYLLFNMYRTLLKYTEDRGLVSDGAKACKRQGKQVVCELNGRKWSNGTPITAANYVASFRRLIDPATGSPQADILFTVKNARRIWKKEQPPAELGVFADSETTLRFELEEDDPEFEYRLIHPSLAPLPPGGYLDKAHVLKQVVSGPYFIKEWKTNSYIKLQNNTYYDSTPRPPAHLYFIDDDTTAMRLYEAGKMTFLRRVTAPDIPRVRKSKEFQQIPVARFDYVGFGPQLLDFPQVREALSLAIDHKGFLKLFDTRTPPGCPSLPGRMMDRTPCQSFDPAKAKALWRGIKNPPKLTYYYSMMGGDDIARAAEWFQAQWKKNLGTAVDLQPQEQGIYLRLLKTNPPAIFRKGVGLDRPTCLGGLEIFSKDHPDNYIHLKDDKYEELLNRVRQAKAVQERKVACRKAVEYLNSTHRLIPLGEMHFSIMSKPSYRGWRLNSLNHLDLSGLVQTPPDRPK
jgi:oligopeptide transport system substrate-binding protein